MSDSDEIRCGSGSYGDYFYSHFSVRAKQWCSPTYSYLTLWTRYSFFLLFLLLLNMHWIISVNGKRDLACCLACWHLDMLCGRMKSKNEFTSSKYTRRIFWMILWIVKERKIQRWFNLYTLDRAKKRPCNYDVIDRI